MYFHASEFMSRLTFALLLEGNYVLFSSKMEWIFFFYICVCVYIYVYEREESNDFSKTKQKLSDLTLQIKCVLCAAQGFDY